MSIFPTSRTPHFRGRSHKKKLDFKNLIFSQTLNRDPIPNIEPVPIIEGNLNLRGDIEAHNDKQILIYLKRPKSMYKENLTSETPKELNPVIAPSNHESFSNQDKFSNPTKFSNIDPSIAHVLYILLPNSCPINFCLPNFMLS